MASGLLRCRADRPALELFELSGDTMGSTYAVKLATEQQLDSRQRAAAHDAVSTVLLAIDRDLSTWRGDSEISRDNAWRDAAPFPLGEASLAVLSESLEVSRQSGGAFDITVAPLVKLWGFGGAARRTTPPADAEIDALIERVGYPKLVLDDQARTARKLHPDLTVDVSAIAPGYAVDRIAGELERLGFTDLMVEIGGEIAVRGHNAEGKPWQLAIEQPDPDQRRVHTVLPVSDLALATSGDYRSFYEAGGTRYSHTHDPRTGRPVTHRLASVSVLAPRCSTADAWATALNVLGPAEGPALAAQLGLPALFLIYRDDGGLDERRTPAFEQLFGK